VTLNIAVVALIPSVKIAIASKENPSVRESEAPVGETKASSNITQR
jgi:hypothetical protein